MTASLASAFEGPTIQTPIRSNLYFSRLYFPQTTTSGPSVVSELIPHETLSSVRHQRFACSLTTAHAWLAAGVARYAFTVTDLHRLPSAGLPAHQGCSTLYSESVKQQGQKIW